MARIVIVLEDTADGRVAQSVNATGAQMMPSGSQLRPTRAVRLCRAITDMVRYDLALDDIPVHCKQPASQTVH